MMTEGKKPSLAFWATIVLIVVLVAYPLSFGPWCWIASRTASHKRGVPSLYRPITMFGELTTAGSTMIEWYGSVLAAEGWELCYDGDIWGMFDVEFAGML